MIDPTSLESPAVANGLVYRYLLPYDGIPSAGRVKKALYPNIGDLTPVFRRAATLRLLFAEYGDHDHLSEGGAGYENPLGV